MIRRAASTQRGMTLVEVLVAFAILAGLVVSVMGLISQNTGFIVVAEERQLASIAADNLITEELARRATPGDGVEEGEIVIASRTFAYTRMVADTGLGAVRIEYAIRPLTSEQTLARASALKGQ